MSRSDVISRLGIAALGGLAAMAISIWFSPPAFTPKALTIYEQGDIVAGCPMTAILSYHQREPSAVTIGIFFARQGRQTALPMAMYDLPAGDHVIGFYVEVPRWLPSGDYRLYVIRSSVGWFGRPDVVRLESERFHIAPPGGACPSS